VERHRGRAVVVLLVHGHGGPRGDGGLVVGEGGALLGTALLGAAGGTEGRGGARLRAGPGAVGGGRRLLACGLLARSGGFGGGRPGRRVLVAAAGGDERDQRGAGDEGRAACRQGTTSKSHSSVYHGGRAPETRPCDRF